MEEELENLMRKRDETIAALGDELWHSTLGSHVETVLKETGVLSLQALRDSLTSAIRARREGDPQRVLAEKALAKLDAITTHPRS